MDPRTFAETERGRPVRAAMRAAPDPHAQQRRRMTLLRRMAMLCAVLVLLITSLSAFMRLSKAGLSCDGWPQCYGQAARELQLGQSVAADEGGAIRVARPVHRLVASTALVLVVLMAALCLGPRPVLWREGRIALALLALVLFLAVLGRWAGAGRTPAVAMGNLLGGFATLALCWRLAVPTKSTTGAARFRVFAWCCVTLLACQVALGGMASAAFAATSCNNLADCLSASAGIPWSALNPWHEPVLAATQPLNSSGALAQTGHWLLGLALAPVLLLLGAAALRLGLRRPGARLLALLAGELVLGLMLAADGSSLALTLAHNAAAALIVATAAELAAGANPERRT
jgi:cytochrome c oxidase assembly protein subunit 15